MAASAQQNSQTQETFSIILHGRICSTEQSNTRDLQYHPSWPHLRNRTVKHKRPSVSSFMAASAQQNNQTQETDSIILHCCICSTGQSNTRDLQYHPTLLHLLNKPVKHKGPTVSSYIAASAQQTSQTQGTYSIILHCCICSTKQSNTRDLQYHPTLLHLLNRTIKHKRSTVSSYIAASAQKNSQTQETYSIILHGRICSTEQSNRRDLQYDPSWLHLLNRTVKQKRPTVLSYMAASAQQNSQT